MKEHGILFKAELIRKILKDEKTQTRRIPSSHNCLLNGYGYGARKWPELDWDSASFAFDSCGRKCKDILAVDNLNINWLLYFIRPRVKKGEVLWVREGWRTLKEWDNIKPSELPKEASIQYSADMSFSDHDVAPDLLGRWRSPLHLPRVFARIFLKVTAARFEYLQGISEEDAIAEGIDIVGGEYSCSPYRNYLKGKQDEMKMHCSSAVRSFQTLWDSINSDRGWPWKDNKPVLVYEFERMK